MGREIRRVPADWEHPKDKQGTYMPLYDEPYNEALREWYENHQLWELGEHPEQNTWGDPCEFYEDYAGQPPTLETYRRRDWEEEEATHYVMYETVSEGTPLTPAFATKKGLVDHLSSEPDAWGHGPVSREAAETFVERGWAPSMLINQATGETKTNVEACGPRR